MAFIAGALLLASPLSGCAGLMGGAAKQAADPALPAVTLNAEEAAIVAETNALRRARGLGELKADGKLTAIARARSRDMAKRNYFGHQTPEGRSVFTIMREQKVAFGAAGENLAKDRHPAAQAPREVVAGWAKSPAHRANLLHEGYGRVGVGAVRASDGQVWVTQIFAD